MLPSFDCTCEGDLPPSRLMSARPEKQQREHCKSQNADASAHTMPNDQYRLSEVIHRRGGGPRGITRRPDGELSDGGHGARRLQPRRPAAVRCSAWLGDWLWFKTLPLMLKLLL